MLKDKAKQLFKEWYTLNNFHISYDLFTNHTPISMRIGVYEDFILTLGYSVLYNEAKNFDDKIWNFIEIEKDNVPIFSQHYQTKEKSRIGIINEINRLIN